MTRAPFIVVLAWSTTLVVGCDVEQNLGASDSDAGAGDNGSGSSGSGPLLPVDGEVIDLEGNPTDSGTSDLVASSAFCAAAEPWACLTRLTLLGRFESGRARGPARIMFDEAGNQYRSFAMGDVAVRTSYAPSGEPRWSRQGNTTTALELGGDRLCVWTLESDNLLPGFEGREINEVTWFNGAVACYDTLGSPLWWRHLELGSWFSVHDFAVDRSGSVYLAGQVQLVDGADSEAFVMQILASGELGWMRVFNGPDDENAVGVTAGPTGVVVVGTMPSQIEIGGVTLEHDNTRTTSSGIANDAGGTWLAALSFDGDPVFAIVLLPTADTREQVWDHELWMDDDGDTVLAIEWVDGWYDIARIDASGAVEIKKLETKQVLSDIAGLVRYGAGFVVAGTCRDERMVADGCLIVLDAELEELSSASFGRSYAHGDAAKLESFDSIARGPDGALYVGGRTADRRDYDPHDPFFARIAAEEP